MPNILVVDDDESNRESLRRRLERRGYAVAVAIDGQTALDHLLQSPVDLVILDVMMPGISGLDVLDKVRLTHSPAQLPIIMATARDQSEDVVAALNRGANDYVTKPLDFAVVSARVRTHLQLKQSVDQILALESDLRGRNDQLKQANDRLQQNADRTARELHAAARVQKAFLPKENPVVAGVNFSWLFEPCTELAGDALNVVLLDHQNIALYVLDVSGHGVAASLLAVTVTQLLSPSSSGESLVVHVGPDGAPHAVDPADVATRLAASFSIETTEQFITLFYAVYNTVTSELKFVSAGHPGAVRIRPGEPPLTLHGTGLPIGVGETYTQQAVPLRQGDRLYLYSDGVTEAMNAGQDLFGPDRLMEELNSAIGKPLQLSVESVRSALSAWRGEAPPRDDISILAMECASG